MWYFYSSTALKHKFDALHLHKEENTVLFTPFYSYLTALFTYQVKIMFKIYDELIILKIDYVYIVILNACHWVRFHFCPQGPSEST